MTYVPYWLTFLLIIIIVIIVISIIVYYYKSRANNLDSVIETPPPEEVTVQDGALGNLLVNYFAVIAWYFTYELDANVKIRYVNDVPINCLDHLPTKIPYNPQIHQNLLQVPKIRKKLSNHHYRVSDWSYNRGILKTMAPLIVEVAKPFINDRTPTDVNPDADVVIHFRCGDSPANRLVEYVLQRFKWYKLALEEAAKQLNKRISDLSVLIISCSNWGLALDKSKQEKLCSTIVNELISYLGDKVLGGTDKITTRCGSVADDFHSMMKAPCLISPGSSLSYIAALTNNNIMITPDYLNIEDKKYRDNWILLSSDDIKHKEVRNYDDIPDVIRRLKDS